MKKIFILFFFIQTISAFSQQDAWVYFNAKPNSAAFFANPIAELNQRSLNRRIAQNIALDFKDAPMHQPFVDQITATSGITVMAKSKWLNALHIRGTFANINALASLSFVSNIQFADYSLNIGSNKIAFENKTIAAFNNQNTTVNYNYGGSNNQISMLSGHLLHQQNYTGTGKIIAVLDAGFPTVNTTQPFARLRDNNLILGGYNYVSRNNNFYSANSHGTLVLSTMGGYTDNQLVGTAPDASYYLFVTEDAITENPVEESLWVEAAEEADRLGVDIINSSLGYFDYDNPLYSHTYNRMNGTTTFISRGANVAFTRGMIVVVSAGNSGNSANPNIAAPADATNVLTVGAVDSTNNYVGFSSRGPSFDGRIKPDVMAKGASATVANTAGAISTADGTSFSSPIIAGMVACLWQALPNKTAIELMQIIRQSSNNYTTPNANYGYGIPNFAQAVSSNLSLSPANLKSFIVYPNPTKTEINFQLTENFKDANIIIYNSLGQNVFQKKSTATTETISLENLSNGIYFYSIDNDINNLTGKFIKN